MSKTISRRCDVCHKREGIELKESDFVDQSLSMKMDNFDGVEMSIFCNITIRPDDDYNDDILIDDVVNSYRPTDQFDAEAHYTGTYPNTRDIAEAQLEQIMMNTNTITHDNSDLCKVCFKTLLSMIEKYAKFDEEVKF